MMNIIEDKRKDQERFDLKMEVLKSIDYLMEQYKALYLDYYQLRNGDNFTGEEFDIIVENKKSAYSIAGEVRDKFSISY